jgi:TonB family protein
MKKLLIFPLILILGSSLFAQTAHNEQLKKAEELNRQAVRLFSQQKFKEALESAKDARDIYKVAAGEYDIRTGRAVRNIAEIYVRLDKFKDAKGAFSDALDIYEKNLPLSDQDKNTYIILLETAGYFEALDEDVNDAEDKLTKAVSLREELNGPDSEPTATALYTLARVYLISGEYEKALPAMMRSIDIKSDDNGTVLRAPSGMETSALCLLSKLGKDDERNALRKRFGHDDPVEPPGPKTRSKAKLIRGGVLNGKATALPVPRYPGRASARRISGIVTVQVLIDETGKVTSACSLSGPRELRYAAESAAYASTFTPTKLSGVPVKVSGVINYNFHGP